MVSKKTPPMVSKKTPPAPPLFDPGVANMFHQTKKSEYNVLLTVFIVILLLGILSGGIVLLVDYLDVKNNGPKCKETKNCASGMYCVSGHCKDKCTSKKQCIGDNEVCENGECRMPDECTAKNPCPFKHFQCKQNKCVRATCDTTEDCPSTNSVCLPSMKQCFTLDDIEYVTGSQKTIWYLCLAIFALIFVFAAKAYGRFKKYLGRNYRSMSLMFLMLSIICFSVNKYFPMYKTEILVSGWVFLILAILLYFFLGGYLASNFIRNTEDQLKEIEKVADILKEGDGRQENLNTLKSLYQAVIENPGDALAHKKLDHFIRWFDEKNPTKKYVTPSYDELEASRYDHTEWNAAMQETKKIESYLRWIPLVGRFQDLYYNQTSYDRSHREQLEKIKSSRDKLNEILQASKKKEGWWSWLKKKDLKEKEKVAPGSV